MQEMQKMQNVQEKQNHDVNSQKIRNKKVSALRVIVIALSGVLMGLCIYVINASLFSGGSLPMPFGVGAGVVLSGSMEPALSVDDVIVVHRESAYHVGDVVVYGHDGSPVVHRIVSVSGNRITTRGDANNADDEPILLSDISGRVVFRIPGAGAAVEFIRSPLGVLMVLGAAIVLLELSFRSERRQSQRDIEKIRAEIDELKKKETKENESLDESI
jgi:signal peptidase I, archaeal type